MIRLRASTRPAMILSFSACAAPATYSQANLAKRSQVGDWAAGTCTHSFIAWPLPRGSNSSAPSTWSASACASPASLKAMSSPQSAAKTLPSTLRHSLPNHLPGTTSRSAPSAAAMSSRICASSILLPPPIPPSVGTGSASSDRESGPTCPIP